MPRKPKDKPRRYGLNTAQSNFRLAATTLEKLLDHKKYGYDSKVEMVETALDRVGRKDNGV
jgi:hypothetical protein